MLSSLLARGTEHLLDVWADYTNSSSSLPSGDVDLYSIDINTLSAFLPSPWRRVASVCGQAISPIYKTVQSILNEDLEHVAGFSSELEPFDQGDVVRNTASNTMPLDLCARYPTDINPNYHIRNSLSPPPRRKRRRSQGPLDYPLMVPSPHSSVPTILITPCPTLPQYTSRVPLQDASHGNKLTVPGHPHFNSSFPPLLSNSRPVHTPFVTRWKWDEGHWWAVVPDLETQVHKGWFSRPLGARRAVRPCSRR
jgi:hypothetical protein